MSKRGKGLRHYFIDRERADDEFFSFHDSIQGMELVIHSASDIFSKSMIDAGTRTLIDTVVENEKIAPSMRVLDLACGYGIIGICMSKIFGCETMMCDINSTAVDLAKINASENDCSKISAVVSDGLDNIDGTFDYIISNPPIKVGKEVLYKILDATISHLNPSGKLYLVIRKDHGMQSVREHLASIFGNCSIVRRNKGYYILSCTKE